MFPLSNLARFPCLVLGYLRIVFCVVHNLYCIPTYLLLTWMASPIFCISPTTYSKIENTLYYWLLYVVSGWSYGAGLVVHEHGDDIYSLPSDGSVKLLVIANHQSTADVPLMMQSFSARSRWTLLWVMDAVFKWTNFGVVSQVHGDYFLRTKSYTTGSMTKHCLRSYSQLKNAILLFPEGGFRYKRLASSNAFALKRGHPLLNYVTYPRFSGYSELMTEQLGVTHVVDLTICYDDPEKPPSILDIVRGTKCSEVHFHYRIHPVAGNEDTIRSESWLFDQWTSKDRLLARHYATMRRLNMTNKLTTSASFDSIKNTTISAGAGDQINGQQRVAKKIDGSLTRKVGEVTTITTNDLSTSDSEDDSHNHQRALLSTTKTTQHQPNGSPKDVEMNRSGEFKSLGLNDNNQKEFKEANEDVVTFEPRLGRPVRLSWPKLTFIHLFALATCLAMGFVIKVLVRGLFHLI